MKALRSSPALAVFGALLGMAILMPTPANAQIFTFGFTELDGDFNGTTSVFTTNVEADTSGDVSRTVPVLGTALYDNDPDGNQNYSDSWFYLGTLGNYGMSLTLTNITTTSADATGAFTITDADGDTISGNINGSWTGGGGVAGFFGLLSNIVLTDNGTQDGTFDGPSGGSFSMDFSSYGAGWFNGAIVTLETGSWFTDGAGNSVSWTDQSTLVTGAVVPAPGATLLGVIGLGAVTWVRRRLN